MKILLSILALALSACLIRDARADTLDYHEFGLLAIQDGGRTKPVDTFARETLLRVSGASTFTSGSGADAKTWSASDFLLSVLFNTHDWRTEPIVLIPYHPLSADLGLDPKRKLFSLDELAGATALPG